MTMNPCPFCGHEDRLSPDTNSDGKWVWVQCSKCSARGPRTTFGETAAIHKWNSLAEPRHRSDVTWTLTLRRFDGQTVSQLSYTILDTEIANLGTSHVGRVATRLHDQVLEHLAKGSFS